MLFAVLVPVLGALTIGLLIYALMPQKSPLSAQLEAIQARNIAAPMHDRFGLLENIFGDEGRSEMQQQLMEAGWYATTPAQMGARVAAGALVGLGIGAVPLIFVHPFAPVVLLVALVPAMIGAYVPFLSLRSAMGKRKVEVQRALPDFLDMVATTVQAGISLNAALGYAVSVAPGALGDEIKEALAQIRLGRNRADSLRAIAVRVNQPQFTSTITAITQAEKLGGNISQVLGELAEDVRNQRIMYVEEQAAKLTIKMIFPMVAFLLPALFLIIFGALAAQLIPQYLGWGG
ncbi:MAG: type II secretion system F family protein [Candidatus Velthaea sp.]